MNISVVVPVYNGEDTLTELVERLGKVLPTVSDSYETILVCDGSPDHSWQVIEQLVARMQQLGLPPPPLAGQPGAPQWPS